MCVKWTGDWEVAAKDLTAFKAVLRAGKSYQSSVPLHRRDGQQQPGTKGKVLQYRKGRYVEGDEPGIYCFETPAMAKDHHQEEGIAVIEVKIPKGTRIRRGRAIIEDTKGNDLELLTINAMRVKVVREIDEKLLKKCLWPGPRSVSRKFMTGTPVWDYYTASGWNQITVTGSSATTTTWIVG